MIITLYGKVFAEKMKLRILGYKDCPGLSDWVLNVIPNAFRRERDIPKDIRHRGKGNKVTMEAEVGVMSLQFKAIQQPPITDSRSKISLRTWRWLGALPTP